MVVEVFVAQGQAVDALGDEFLQGVFDEIGIAEICETGGELAKDAGELLGLPQQQGATIGGDVATVEVGENLAGAEDGKIEVG
jgi:hypothetical protein